MYIYIYIYIYIPLVAGSWLIYAGMRTLTVVRVRRPVDTYLTTRLSGDALR